GNYILFIVTIFSANVTAQGIEGFLKPADTLDVKRRNAAIITGAAIATGSIIALNEVWYADYPKSSFHFVNDNAEWLQMDKAGHVFTSYHLGNFTKEALQWTGISERNSLIYGATAGFVFISALEVLDGHSAKWGASAGDLAANAAGT